MWSFFSRDPSKDFNYDIGDEILGLEDRSIWKLHRGKKKNTGDDVSIFCFDVKSNSEVQLNLARSSVKKLKTLRHPSIVTYLDGLETDKVIYVVTEYVEPLTTYLESDDSGKLQKDNLGISWGLHQVVKGINFLNNDCGLVHNNVCLWSIFVNKAGEWKIAGLEYMYPYAESASPPLKILPLLERYNPPEISDSAKKVSSTKWSIDMWGFGCLIWEAFNGPLTKSSSLRSTEKIPKSLMPHYCELVGANPMRRPNPAFILTECEKKGGFFNNTFVNTLLFLEEIQIKEPTETVMFFNRLTPLLDNFPPDVCKYKILPQLLYAFEFGNAGSAVLTPMFKLGKLLDDNEYQKKIVPCVVKLFSSTDRATRARLLQQIEHFVAHLLPPLVNEQIFPQVVQGFMDTNPTIRETTVKAMLHLASKLNYNNLNVELMKHFARLQAKDDQGGVRTNTTICLGKIAAFLHPQTRQKVLVAAFTRAMRDPFPPARAAGIMALAATQSYYPMQDVATKVIPALSPSCTDCEKDVREHAFRTIKGFLNKLEKVSDDPSLATEFEAEVNAVNSPTVADTAASWAGWAVTSLTSKFYKSGQGRKTTSDDVSSDGKSPTTNTAFMSSNETQQSDNRMNIEVSKKQDEDSDGDEWNEDWGQLDNASTRFAESETSPLPTSIRENPQTDGWEDWTGIEDELDLEEDKPECKSPSEDVAFVSTDSNIKRTSSYNWDEKHSTKDTFFISQQSLYKSSQAETNLVSSTSQSSGWDVEDNWDTWKPSAPEPSAKLSKEQREERRLQRQKELQEKRMARQASGAMKLGERKTLPKP